MVTPQSHTTTHNKHYSSLAFNTSHCEVLRSIYANLSSWVWVVWKCTLSVRTSKIANEWSGIGCFIAVPIWQQWASILYGTFWIVARESHVWGLLFQRRFPSRRCDVRASRSAWHCTWTAARILAWAPAVSVSTLSARDSEENMAASVSSASKTQSSVTGKVRLPCWIYLLSPRRHCY